MKQKTKFKQTEIGMIPADWDVTQLRDILLQDVRHGIYKTKKYFNENGVKILKMGNINSNDRISNQDMERVIVTNEEVKKFEIHKGNLIFARTSMMTGGLGNCSLVLEHDEPIIFDGNLLCADIDLSIANPEFYLYYFKTKRGRNEIHKMTGGTQSRNIPGSKLMKVNVPILEKQEQKAIVKILSDLDSKIELLQNQNKTFEAIGQALFKQWFIDFEFPNEKGKPYKSSGGEMVDSELGDIPKGWRVGFLGDEILTSLSAVGIDEFENEKTYLATANVMDADVTDYSTKITYKSRPSRANMQPRANTVWFAKMKDSRKILFFDNYHKYGLNNVILSTGFAGLDVKDYALYYIWCLISGKKFDKIKNRFCTGTTMQAINNETIKKIKIVIPSERILKIFTNTTKYLYQNINNNNMETYTLSKIKDALLPKLMSGQIRVKVPETVASK